MEIYFDVEVKYTIITPLAPIQGAKDEKRIRKYIEKNKDKLPNEKFHFVDGNIIFEELVTIYN